MDILALLVFICAGSTHVVAEICYQSYSYYSFVYHKTRYQRQSYTYCYSNQYCCGEYTCCYYYDYYDYYDSYTKSTVSSGTLAGIAIGSMIGFVILVCLCCACCRAAQKQLQNPQAAQSTSAAFTVTSQNVTLQNTNRTQSTCPELSEMMTNTGTFNSAFTSDGGQRGVVMNPLAVPPPSYDDISKSPSVPPPSYEDVYKTSHSNQL